MGTIPMDEKVFMVSKDANTKYTGSANLKGLQEWYTMNDISNTVKPYKVFTALLTQEGDNTPNEVFGGDLEIGRTYLISNNEGADWTNVGAPDNEVGTNFMATGSTPNSWGTSGILIYYGGSPVANVLENTIGYIYTKYMEKGAYSINSKKLFKEGKTTIEINTIGNNGDMTTLIGTTAPGNEEEIIIYATKEGALSDDILFRNKIEIRVYN